MYATRHPAGGSDDLGVTGMADQDHLTPFADVIAPFLVHLGDEWAGRVDDRQPAPLGLVLDAGGDTVGAEDGHAAGRYFVKLLDEHRPFRFQGINDPLVVHDLVADVDRRAIEVQGALDDLDGALDTGTEAARLGKKDAKTGKRRGSNVHVQAFVRSWRSPLKIRRHAGKEKVRKTRKINGVASVLSQTP